MKTTKKPRQIKPAKQPLVPPSVQRKLLAQERQIAALEAEVQKLRMQAATECACG